MDRIRELIEELMDRVRRLRISGNHINVAATCLSAVAAAFAYFAAQKSADVADRADEFTERFATIQNKASRPKLNVISAKLTRETGDSRLVSMTLTLRNSGERDAVSVWVAYYPSWEMGTSVQEIASIPRDTEITISRELDGYTSGEPTVRLQFAFVDISPNPSAKGPEFDSNCILPPPFVLDGRDFIFSPAYKSEHWTEFTLPPAVTDNPSAYGNSDATNPYVKMISVLKDAVRSKSRQDGHPCFPT